jgi:hypothetical protein
MPLMRDENCVWTVEFDEADRETIERSHPSYFEALPRYLTALEPAFKHAKEASEFNLLLSIFAVRGMQDAGWDPYETTVRAIGAIRGIHQREIDGEASRHLGLWLYGHIMEASEPYEFLGNLIDVAVGGRFRIVRFPPRQGGAPPSPQIKIERLEEQATAAGMPEVVTPMKEAWNREFRNAIFHADYSLHGSEVRTIRPLRSYAHDTVMMLVNRALAYHETMSILRKLYIESYTEPVMIPCDPKFSHDLQEKAVVIVREGYGAAGLKDGWTEKELSQGRIPYRMGRFSREEMQMLDADRTLALLPARNSNSQPQ